MTIAVCGAYSGLSGQLVVRDFDGITGQNTISASSFATFPAGSISASDISVGSGLLRRNENNGIEFRRWDTSNTLDVANNDYIGFELTIGVGHEANFGDLTFDFRGRDTGSSNGPDKFAVFTSVDGFTAGKEVDTFNIAGNPSIGTVSFDLSSLSNITGTIEVRIYGWESGANKGDIKFKSTSDSDIVLSGEVIPEPSTYALIFGSIALAGVLIVKSRTRIKEQAA